MHHSTHLLVPAEGQLGGGQDVGQCSEAMEQHGRKLDHQNEREEEHEHQTDGFQLEVLLRDQHLRESESCWGPEWWPRSHSRGPSASRSRLSQLLADVPQNKHALTFLERHARLHCPVFYSEVAPLESRQPICRRVTLRRYRR